MSVGRTTGRPHGISMRIRLWHPICRSNKGCWMCGADAAGEQIDITAFMDLSIHIPYSCVIRLKRLLHLPHGCIRFTPPS